MNREGTSYRHCTIGGLLLSALTFTLTLSATCHQVWGQGVSEIIVRNGVTAPDGNGTTNFFGAPVVNNNGQAAFWFLLNNTNNGIADDQGVFRGSTTPGSLTIIARELQVAPDGNGTYANFELLGTAGAINDNGAVAFRTALINTSGGTANDGVFVGSGGAITQIARIDQPAPGGGNFDDFEVFPFDRGGMAVNNAAQVTFFGIRNGTEEIFSGSGGATSRITNAIETFWALHPSGQAAYRASGANEIFRASGGAPVQIVELTQAAPDGNGRFQDLLDIAVNSSGQVAFASFMDNTTGGILDDKGIFRGTGGAITQIMRSGQPVPIGSGVIDDFFGSQPSINASGQVAFGVRLRATAGGADDDSAILRGSGGALTQIVREGQAAPDGNGEFDLIAINNETNFGYHAPAINDLGWVAFRADLRNTADGTDDDNGLFVGDGIDVVQVAREGQMFDGGTMLAPAFVSIPNEDRGGFNDSGQVAYRFQTVDPGFNVETFVTLWTPPDVQWVGGSGAWSDANKWAQGVIPKSLFHTTLNPTGGAAITGGFTTEHVRSLTIGGGNDDVTLNLQAGSILAVMDQPLTVAQNGILTGGGIVEGTLANTSNGEVIAGPGQQLVFTGVGNDSQGRVTLSGGELRFSQDFTNNGLVIGNGTLRADGGIANNGDMALSATSNLIGDVTNDPSGMIVTAGGTTTFLDDLVNDGEIRTSPGAFTVLFGTVGGTGNFTGAGTVAMEGDFTPGASPAAIEFGGNLIFGPGATLRTEIGGISAGSQHDRVEVVANVALAGQLHVDLIANFVPVFNHEFTVLTAGTLEGSFSNIASGQRLDTAGGEGSFLVTYDGLSDAVILSEFLRPFLLGDMDGNGQLDAFDVDDFELALADRATYIATHPGLAPDALGDFDGSGVLDAFDVAGFEGALAGITVPEPAGLAGFAVVGAILARWRRDVGVY